MEKGIYAKVRSREEESGAKELRRRRGRGKMTNAATQGYV
jgi:hypothetical protein